MATWYLSKIKFQREDEAGSLKSISEAYLVDAVSYTEAEARMFQEIAANTPDFQITNLSRMKIAEVFDFEDTETWYKVKVLFVSFDEKAQKEKKIPHIMLVNAETVRQAYDRVEERLGTIDDYEITDVNVTPILEIFPYENSTMRNLIPLAAVTQIVEA